MSENTKSEAKEPSGTAVKPSAKKSEVPAASAAPTSGAGMVAKNGGASKADDIVIGLGVTTSGKLHTGGGVFVDGVLHDADVQSTILSISRDGAFQGRAQVDRIEIAGNLEGEVNATEEIVLRSSASVSGKLSSPYIVVHRGACVSGETTTLQRKTEATRYSPPPPPAFGARRKRGAMLFSIAIVGILLSSGAAFALLGGG